MASKARCHWCGSPFIRIDDFYWCSTAACRTRQAEHAKAVRINVDGDPDNSQLVYLYVPLPRQVEFHECTARNLLGGGAAGSTKSHVCRWSLYDRALRIQNYEALLIRKTWGELEKHHFRLMEQEAAKFRKVGINAEFFLSKREMHFHDTGAIIEGGHLDSQEDVDKCLSRERDDIAVDEGVTLNPRFLLEVSTRARSTKQAVLDDGGARFRIYTNPGGESEVMLYDFFIAKEPNWEDYAPKFKELYDPSRFAYIPGGLEDNPYLPEDYESDLALLAPWRFQQLRYNDWSVRSGTFFTEFAESVHVKDLKLDANNGNFEWFCSLDWGYIKPGCNLWWCCLGDGILYVRRDFKFSHATIDLVVKNIREVEHDLGIDDANIRYRVADPALEGPDVTSASKAGKLTGESMKETFANCGMPVLMGKNDRTNGWQRVRELLKLREDQRPTLIIHPDCKYLIRTLAAAQSAKGDPEDVNTNSDDHAIDALRYGAMTRPSPTRTKSLGHPNSFNATRARMLEFRKRNAVAVGSTR